MSNRKVHIPIVYVAFVVLLTTGCGASTSEPQSSSTPTLSPPTATPTATVEPPPPTAVPSPTTEPLAEHRIGVRVVDGVGEFYDRVTGEKFVPRGNNYIRLAAQTGFSGEPFVYHSTFNVGLYDPQKVEEALSKMHGDGYNVVRVFVQGSCRSVCIGDPAGGLNKDYIANVADFLRIAKANEIFAIITTDAEPGTPYYIHLLDSTWSEDFGGTNSSYLRGGGVLDGKTFWQDFIDALIAQKAPLDAILAYQLRNELFFETNAGPLNHTKGVVGAANGKTYDMASETDRQRMMDENLVFWIDQIRSAILERDPTALVTVGFFPPDAPNPWNSAPRYIRTYPAVWQSTIDFIDFHPYPGGYGLDKLVENLGMSGMEEKPIIMGEFGAARSTYASAAATARVLQDWQVESCKYGFDGWLLWTWDSVEQPDFYNGLADGGKINQVLAPVNRPDPCQAGDFPFIEQNLALRKAVSASRSLESNPAAFAVDGTANDWWGSGAFAPQWIEIDLGEPTTIGLIRLVTSQSPAGNTRHQIWVGLNWDSLFLLHTFEGYTRDQQVFEFRPEAPVKNVRYVRVMTRQSPSWVSWREIEVIAP